LKIYRNAAEVLPPELLERLQEYVQGVHIYVPIKGQPARWGEKSGTRRQLAERNEEIRRCYAAGEDIDALADRFFLSCDSVRKILRKKGE
jgi:Mor family transcriptional regulator